MQRMDGSVRHCSRHRRHGLAEQMATVQMLHTPRRFTDEHVVTLRLDVEHR